MTTPSEEDFTDFRGRYVVLKVGGTADVQRGRIGADVRALVEAGARVIVAHGGGDALRTISRSGAKRRPGSTGYG